MMMTLAPSRSARSTCFHHKTLDEMASEAVMEGLKAERLNLVQTLAKGHRHGAASGISEDQVVDVIHADREQRGRAR
jgi:hypothetical protein